ncbi:hypothetical protein CXG81DRAFT_29525 [Caulochytrium protostelioides]|uniref:Snf7-domain-containing protein n=1 Tax=Caulochytrium protostelioides TaxID=1555241 RepID=A0A4P9WW51_9FUNG|nr:hypothetical protein CAUPRSCDRAFT_9842 [Caulochytrium protostelioides]RKP02309.1 hypothetical protein CXG81DRAFT_29525 [Caulochytrium protostelioides]|eukprot:RKP02309.1 hypothetical protein CXG81DRAFT_29525 [Caulochytrium protostelioides]
MSFLGGLFGPRLTPEEQVKKWRQQLRGTERDIDKQIRGIDAEALKVQRQIKLAAKRNDRASCGILARELVRSRHAKDRLVTSKAQLNSLGMQMQQQLGTMKIAGTVQTSTEVMKLMNGLVKLPAISATMQALSKEMMKAGVIDEMINDTIEGLDEEDVEDEAQDEVNQVLHEITDGLLGQAGAVGPDLEMPQDAPEHETPIDEMQARLDALREA